MIDCVILYRVNGGPVEFVYNPENENEPIAVFGSLDDAISYTEANALFLSGQADFQIVELNEL
jgi:hypothetical protein